MIAAELLRNAEEMISEPRYSIAGVWPRAAALLARQAIEAAMLEAWLVRAPGLELCTTHAQLLCLSDYMRSQEIAQNAALAWSSLSRICHHHPYELVPTAAELRVLLEGAQFFVAALASDLGLETD
jgi:hypothetical protein